MKSFVREVTPGKQQPHPKVLRKSHPFLFTGWRICLEAVPTPSCHQGSTGGNPRLSLPTHLSLHILPIDLCFFPDAAADHFSLILPQSQLCWVAGPSHPRDIPLPGYNH